MNILIVEDDPMVSNVNRRFAEKLPFVSEVFTSYNLEDAKVLLKAQPVDLVLLDVYFPQGKGPDLLKWIRGEGFSLEVIFITADKSHDTVEKALQLGAMDYLVKPFTMERFTLAITEAEARIRRLSASQEVDQDSLDRMFKGAPAKPAMEGGEIGLDKGLSERTYITISKGFDRVLSPFTADQLASEIGLARVTVRRYLDFMVRQGKLQVRLEYGKIGRPQHFYTLKGAE